MSEPTTPPNASQTPAPPQRCRFIKTTGEQCRSVVFNNDQFCWSHHWHRTPQFAGVKGYDRTPLLEDTGSINLIVSNAMQGLLDGTLSEKRARAVFYGAGVANAVLRTELFQQRFLAERKERPEEPVTHATNLDTDPLAPPQEYRGPNNKFEPTWSFSKYRYVEECKSLGKALPQSEADMPASGWMSEEENEEDVQTWAKRYEDKIDGLKAAIKKREEDESAAALAAGLPDPHPKPRFNTICPYGIDWCAGARGDHRCTYCKGNLDWNEVHPDQPPIDPPPYSPLYKPPQPAAAAPVTCNPSPETQAAAAPVTCNLSPETSPSPELEEPLDLNAAAEPGRSVRHPLPAVPNAVPCAVPNAERGTPSWPPPL